MTEEKVTQTAEEQNLISLRDSLPYQYAAIICRRIKSRKDIVEPITAQQVRLVFLDEIQNPDIIKPVLQEAWKLHEEMKEIKAMKGKKIS